MKNKIVLSIAGFDPSSGAGIQADLKSFSFLGLHGTTVVTCITSQNTQQVKKIHKLPGEIIENQIDILFEDFNIDAVKTGMLFDEEIVKCVAKKISEYRLSPVVDPVMIATSGDTLSQNDFINSFKKYLLPQAFMVTGTAVPAGVHRSNCLGRIQLRLRSLESQSTYLGTLLQSGSRETVR